MDTFVINDADGVDRRIARPTHRERDVLRGLDRGLANKEIAFKLKMAVRTVEGHISECMVKLGFDNRLQIARWLWFYPKVLRGDAADIKLHLPGCACLHPRCVEMLAYDMAAPAPLPTAA